MKLGSDSCNLQFGYNLQNNLFTKRLHRTITFLQLSRTVVCQDHFYSTKTCCLVNRNKKKKTTKTCCLVNKNNKKKKTTTKTCWLQTKNSVFKPHLIYLLKIKTIFIVDEKLKVWQCLTFQIYWALTSANSCQSFYCKSIPIY